MPIVKPKFVPGVIKDDSKLSTEGGWTDADKMRFVGDKPQVIGGKQALSLANDSTVVFDSVVFDSVVFDSAFVQGAALYPGQARGAVAWADNDGTPYVAWGTGSGLFVMYGGIIYDITPADFTPELTTDSLPYGGGLYGSGPYGRGSRVLWTLDPWGENLLASPRGGKLYEWTPGTAKALIVANAPEIITTFFVSPERIVVLLGTAEFGGSTFNPMLVRWCDQGDNTQWTPAPTNLAGEFPVSRGSKLLAGRAARGVNVLWSDSTFYTMNFTGSVSSVFIIRALGHDCGILGPLAHTASDSAVFWVSNNRNFYVFNGQTAQIMPCPLRQDVFDNMFPNNEEKTHVGWNAAFGEAWFFYPDFRDGTGECSRYAMVNSQGQWAPGTFDITSWVPAGIYPYPIGFSASTMRLYYHEVPEVGDDEDPLEAYIESGFIDVGDGDTLYIIKRIIPDFKSQGPNVSITLKTKLWPNETETSHGPYSATPTTNKIDMLVKAREMAVRLESSGSTPDSFWELGAIGFDSQQSGEKR